MMRWLKGLWYARLRRIDRDILWPACRNQAVDLDHAKAAFAVHAFHDKAWLWLGKERLMDEIDRLT